MQSPESHFSSADLDSLELGPGHFYFKQAARPEGSDVHSSGNTACHSPSSCKS